MRKHNLAFYTDRFLPHVLSDRLGGPLEQFNEEVIAIAAQLGASVKQTGDTGRNFYALTTNGFIISSNGYVCREVGGLEHPNAELLDALEMLLADAEDLTCYQACGLAYENEQHPLHTSIMAARAAIAKAKGE